MFEAISELSNETQRRSRGSTHSYPDSRITRKVIADDGDGFLRLANESRYRHFVRIPARIIRCLDYFQVSCDRDAAACILRHYYLFIGVIDHAIDSGNSETASLVFQHLAKEKLESHSELSDVVLITEHLKYQINGNVKLIFRQQLAYLYEIVRQERAATSMEEYIDVRKAVGRLTADLSYLLISSLLDREYLTLRHFMQRVGAVGCLVDSVIDLSADKRQGLLNFCPTLSDRFRLVWITLFEGLSVGLTHPRLTGLFALAILDNIRDRFPVSFQ